MLLKTTLLLGTVLVAADDSCNHLGVSLANDGSCDDSSWGATRDGTLEGTLLCEDGTDDTDCTIPAGWTCENTCTITDLGTSTNMNFNDNICDESNLKVGSVCDYGTDCADCGPANLANRCDNSCAGSD